MTLDDQSSEEMFLVSLEGDYEDDSAWDAVRVLRRRNTEEVFQLATMHLNSETPKHRARAMDVLAQLGAGKPTSERVQPDECVALALAHLSDPDALVVHSAAWALAHRNEDERAITALIELRHNTDPGVRLAAATGMAGSERPDAIRTLIELMDDSDDEVRNWATFGLGTQCMPQDSDAIRDALRKRLNDSLIDARNEAVWGLALRRDPEGLQLLLESLETEEGPAGDEMVAAEILDLPLDTPVDELRAGLRKLLG